METDAKYPKRKPLRLKHYDYSTPGAYFITICTAGKQCCLSTICMSGSPTKPTVGDGTERLENATVWRFQQGRAKPMDLARPVVKLTSIGRIIERQIEAIPKRFPTVTVDVYVIMPNHIHLLVLLHRDPDREDSAGRASLTGRASPSPTVGDVIRVLKSLSTREGRAYAGDSPVWQRGYYDHIIRDEKDYGEIWAYIEENPLRWAEDSLFVME